MNGQRGLFMLTDKAPAIKAGEYKYMTQGGIPVGNLLVMFSIFSNEKDFVDVSIARSRTLRSAIPSPERPACFAG